jgi:hypothetical protein
LQKTSETKDSSFLRDVEILGLAEGKGKDARLMALRVFACLRETSVAAFTLSSSQCLLRMSSVTLWRNIADKISPQRR